MEHIKHCAVIVRRPEDVWEGTRTALGLAAHNYWAYLFVVGLKIVMTDALKENLEWLDEMECECCSNVEENAEYDFKFKSLEEIARELKKMDLIIPFGNRT